VTPLRDLALDPNTAFVWSQCLRRFDRVQLPLIPRVARPPPVALPKSYNYVTLPSFIHKCGLSCPFEYAGGADTGVTGHGYHRAPHPSFNQAGDSGRKEPSSYRS
jgi:hypothetical protein